MFGSKTRQVVETIKRIAYRHEISKGLMALSGGADSIATAFLIQKSGVKISALHCNFQLRGYESIRDRIFVEEFCNNYNIPLLIKDFDVFDYIEAHPGESIEMACRNLRYKWFFNQLSSTGADRIITGHNADDNIETFFINMLRGCGTRGLKGMEMDSGVIWRPLLHIHKEDILEIIKENNLSYITDSTNLSSDYRRNYLRNEIIPALKDKWLGFNKAMDSTLNHIAEENKIIEDSLNKILSETGYKLQVDTILNYPAPLLLIRRFIDRLKPFPSIAEEVLAAIKADKPHIRHWSLKLGKLILRNKCLSIEMSHCESRT